MKTLPDDTVLPCVGCGQPVSHAECVVDRDGWWHNDCEVKAWNDSGNGAMNMKAPFKKEWQEAKAVLLGTRAAV